MSLYESGASSGAVSLKDVCENAANDVYIGDVELNKVIELILVGGWPSVNGMSTKQGTLVAKEYIKSVLNEDLYKVDNIKRDAHKVELLLKSLARNESTTVTNKTLKEVDYTNYDILLLPGGPAVFKELHQLDIISLIILDYAKKNKIIASICAAPSLVGKLGLFEGKKYTCFPGCDSPITKGLNTGKEVVVDGNYITARSMYYSADFAIAIIEKALGSAKAKEIKNQIMGKK